MEAKENEGVANMELLRLEHKANGGASWFFWIAGLSLVNSILFYLKVPFILIFGLGVTQVVDSIASEFGAIGVALSFVMNIMILGVFVLFGIFARRRHVWAAVVGMILYALDGGLFLLLPQPDYLSIGFHLLALVFMATGLGAMLKLKALQKAPAGVSGTALPYGDEEERFRPNR
jgi:hypothetical protein